MEKYFITITNERGDVLPGYRVQVSNGDGSAVNIFADASGTQFTDGGSVVNYAISSTVGKVEFYWEPARGQNLQILDPSGNLQDTVDDFANIIAFPVPVNEKTGTSETININDGNSVVVCDNASAITLTVPPHADVPIPIGSFIEVHQKGAGAIALTEGTGVTIKSRGSLVTTAGQDAVAGLRKIEDNVWRAAGDLV